MGVDDGGVGMFLGIDPGRDKVGWALVDAEGELRLSGIFRVEDAGSFFGAFESGAPERLAPFILENPSAETTDFSSAECLMGDGTGKEYLLSLAQSASLGVKLVSERETTLLARKLYWKLHPPRGVWRFISTGLRVPPRDIDDLAAWAIVLRYCGMQSNEK